MYDLLIQNGNIIDGTGNKAYFADIATAGGEIVAIGKLDGNAVTKVEAEGMVVSPGFIDLHTHSDLSFLLDPTAQSKVRQGVTMELIGNCGMSPAAPLIGESKEMLMLNLSRYENDGGIADKINWTDYAGYINASKKRGAGPKK